MEENKISCNTVFKSNSLESINPPVELRLHIVMPLEIHWKPKEDITAYELAMCIPILLRGHMVMPYEVDKSLSHFRHFEIIDHNK